MTFQAQNSFFSSSKIIVFCLLLWFFVVCFSSLTDGWGCMCLSSGRKQNITPVGHSSCQLWSLFWEGLWLHKKSLPLSLCLIQGSQFYPKKLFERNTFPHISQSWALGCMWQSQISQDCFLKESTCLLLSTLCLIAVKLHWFSQYSNVPMTLGKNACTSLLPHTQ